MYININFKQRENNNNNNNNNIATNYKTVVTFDYVTLSV